MRYLILKPRQDSFDPRHVVIKDQAHLHELIPPIADCRTEAEAVSCVRRAFPGAMGMPVDLKIGAGRTVVMCFVEDPGEQIDPTGDLEFVCFVQPVTESPLDRKALERAVGGRVDLVFDRKMWALKPVVPPLFRTMPIEWRTSENDAPVFLDARVGYDNGHLVIYAEIGNHSFSVMFQKTGLVIVDEAKEEVDRAADRADAASL